MKNSFLFKVLFVIISLISSSFCQQDIDDKQVSQFSTGKDKITFIVLDYDTDEPLIGAEIYSFQQQKILATTDIDGIAITEKVLKGNLEVSYIGYYPECFKLNNDSIDSIKLWLKQAPLNFGDGIVNLDTNTVSPIEKGESDAKEDIIESKIQLLTGSDPAEEQLLYAENHNFEFKLWEGNKSYRAAYNEVVIAFLNKKFDINIEEELRRICWRNYQP